MKIFIYIFFLFIAQQASANYQAVGVTDKCEWYDWDADDYCYTDTIYPTPEAACASYDQSHPFGNDYHNYPTGFIPWSETLCVPTNEGYPDEYYGVPIRKAPIYPIACLIHQIPLRDKNGVVIDCKYAELICRESEIPVYDDSGKLKHCKLQKACLPTQRSYYDNLGNLAACEDIPIIDNRNKENEKNNLLKGTSSLFDDILKAFTNLSETFTNLFDQLKNIFNNNGGQPDTDQPENYEISASHSDLTESNFIFSLFPTSVICPPDNNLNLLGKIYSFSYLKLCNALSLLSNFVMLISIYMGYRFLRSA